LALLEVKDLRVSYSFPVLLGVSFEVKEGETCVLFGLNGAGKTTTVSTIAGLLTPDSGSITFDGEEIAGRPTPELVRKGIALCPEGRRVFPELTVTQNLKLGAWSRRAHPKEVAETLELVFSYFPVLEGRPNQMGGTLSGGEQQMLAVARAMMSRPKLLLVDEASLGLSPLLATTVFRAVNKINESGTTVIIVEQNVGVLPYAKRVLILEKGTLVYQGVGAEIRKINLREQYLGGTKARGDGARPKSKPKPKPRQSRTTRGVRGAGGAKRSRAAKRRSPPRRKARR
jgi:branched-chain amino acid transport system ATP-binding protein